MRIDAQALLADAFRFENAVADGRKNRIALGRSGGVTGYYALEAGRHVVDAASALLEVTEALWQIGAGQVALRQSSRLEGVRFELAVPPGGAATTMHLDVKSAALAGIEYAAGELVVTGGVTVHDLVVERAADGRLAVAVGTLIARAMSVSHPKLKLTAVEMRVEKVRVEVVGGPPRVIAERVQLTGVALASGGTPVEIGGVEARGLSFAGQHLELAEVALSEAKVDHTFSPRKPAEAAPGPRAMPDIPALDQLEGSLAVDAKVTAALAILENREVHHPLRIPIEAGSVSFKNLEHSLSSLEDAVLDFEVEKDELILELDVIPIVHFDNVTLVSWSLVDPADRELAKQGRVSLRRLLQYHLPPPRPRKEAEPGKKKKVRLLRLDFAPIAIAVSVPAPAEVALGGGVVRLGETGKKSIESVTVSGDVHMAFEGEPVPGHLDVAVTGVHAGVDRLSLGAVRLLRAGLDVGAASAGLRFGNLSPQSVSGSLRDVRVRDVALEIAPKAR